MEIREIIEAAGGHSALATAIGKHRTSLYSWTRVPVQHVKTVEHLSGLPRHVIRPDVYDLPSAEAVA